MEIQRADLAYRRRVMRTLVAVAILLCITMVALQFWLHYISVHMEVMQLVLTVRLMLCACVALIGICIAVLGAHLLARGNLIVRGRRFPPRDVRAIRDTAVREGDAAVRIGRTSQTLGIVFLALALLVAVCGWLWLGRWKIDLQPDAAPAHSTVSMRSTRASARPRSSTARNVYSPAAPGCHSSGSPGRVAPTKPSSTNQYNSCTPASALAFNAMRSSPSRLSLRV